MGEDYKGLPKPDDMDGNFTQVPNEYYDEVLPRLTSMAEIKVVEIIMRKTYGWHKEQDQISYSQFKEATGINSNGTIQRGIEGAAEKGLIEVIKTSENKANIYRMVYKESEEETIESEEPEEMEDFDKEELGIETRVNEKDKALAELFDKQKEDMDTIKKPKKKKGRQSFKDKPLEEWNCNDLLYYFGDRYKQQLDLPYPPISGKQRKLAKKLIDDSEYSTLELVKAVNYYLENYDKLDFLPNDYPAWNIFYGYRDSIIPRALLDKEPNKTKTGKNSTREYEEVSEEEGTWAISWDE